MTRADRKAEEARRFAVREGGDKSYRLGPVGYPDEATDTQVLKKCLVFFVALVVVIVAVWWLL
jgi:hypothetical protein